MTKDHGLEVDLQLTNQCPLTCDHCVYDSRMTEDRGLPPNVVSRLCGEIAELNASQVSITGGEPFIRKDLLEVISAIDKLGIEVCVQTSGLLHDRIDFGKLRESGLDLLLVSIDGPASYHDKFRHRVGIFNDAVKTASLAIAHGIPVRINTVVTKSNVQQVMELLPMAQDLGVDIFSFFYFSPVGRGAGYAAEVLSFSEWNRFEGNVRDWCEQHHPEPDMGVKLQSVAVPITAIPLEGQHCRIKDRDNILILANGDVYPCVFVCHRQELCLGNILQDSLVNIWQQSKIWTSQYDPFYINDGKDCGGAVRRCSGGCPAMRDLMRAQDGFCDSRCEWQSSGLVPGCAREYQSVSGLMRPPIRTGGDYDSAT